MVIALYRKVGYSQPQATRATRTEEIKMTQYRVESLFKGEVAHRSPKLSRSKAEAELTSVKRNHELLIERELRIDPRGEASPTVQRGRQWSARIVEA